VADDANNFDSKLSPKCVKVARPTLFGYIETREEFEYYTNELFSLLKSGQLKTKIHKIYPLEEIAQVHKVRNLTFPCSSAATANLPAS
jgi:NADPH:quinone reductase-like Zn-dependent oxidoreductase